MGNILIVFFQIMCQNCRILDYLLYFCGNKGIFQLWTIKKTVILRA